MLFVLADVADAAQRRREPGLGLQDGRDDVAMRQHRAFRQPGGAAGVLQERDRIQALRRRPQCLARAFGERRAEAASPCGRPSAAAGRPAPSCARWRTANVIHAPYAPPSKSPMRRDHDVLHRRMLDHLLQRVAEVLEDHDGGRARVLAAGARSSRAV